MPSGRTRLCALLFACIILFLCAWMPSGGQTKPDPQKQNRQKPNEDRQSPAPPGADYSGMYSFLRDGEFVQLTVEDNGRVIGFVSRYAEGNGGFIDHLFKSGKLDGKQIAFTTETVNSMWFDFRGTVERGEGKSRGDEAYYVLKGTLIENKASEANKTSSNTHEVALTSFPQDMSPSPAEKK